MLKRLEIKWNNDWSNDGYLYFAQRIVEMLDYTTVDIYRTPLLNTNRLIDEYVSVYNNTKNPKQLELIKEEFLQSLRNDEVLKYKYSQTKLEYLTTLIVSSNDSIEGFKYLQTTIGRCYFIWCKEYIRFIVKHPKEKRKIESAVRCFIPELLRYGYSRDEIYHNAKEILLSPEANPEKALEQFIDIYNNEEHDYTVYLLFMKQIKEFKSILSDHLKLDFNLDDKTKLMNPKDQYVVAKLINVKALDASNAANNAIKSIELFLDFYQYLGNYDSSLVKRNVWVYDENGTCRKLVVNREKYKSVEENSQSLIGQLSETMINQLFAGARCSLGRLIEIIKVHNRAISNNGLENGFLNLWSILEMVCVSEIGKNKGDEVKKVLIPILQRDYLVTIFNDIENNLALILTKEEYKNLLESIVEETDHSTEKIAMFLLLDKYGDKVDEFVDQLVNYPVLRTRILDIRDNCHTMSNLFNMSERYSQRVSWHISRLYRARNEIIHSGKKIKDIKDLGEHLHAYVDSLICEIIIQLCRGSLCEINNVLIDSKLRQDSLFCVLSKHCLFTEKEIKMIFDTSLFYLPQD